MQKKEQMIYNISKIEIKRRITAYTTLIVSFLLSLIVFSFNYITTYLNISIFVILIISIFLLFTRIIVVKYFKSIIKNKIILTPEYIKRSEHTYLIKDIKQINIKRTSKNYLREIKIKFNNNNTIFINGIDDFEEFTKELQSYLSKDCIMAKVREPIDFDHPTFYFFFGIFISFLSFIFIKYLLTLNINQFKIFYYVVSSSTIVMGLYFIIYKPIYKRDEKHNQMADYIWGILFITAGILILLFYIFLL